MINRKGTRVLHPRGSRMMPSTGLSYICLASCDPLDSQSWSFHVERAACENWHQNQLIRCQNIAFSGLLGLTDERTDKWPGQEQNASACQSRGGVKATEINQFHRADWNATVSHHLCIAWSFPARTASLRRKRSCNRKVVGDCGSSSPPGGDARKFTLMVARWRTEIIDDELWPRLSPGSS